ncbi:cation:proton antiporter domain-containing protein [Fischerella sp. PCC 9605]|uniref:cation:proton antiporter domain-containing protein n=1 Tax=Fischerella sp. PCC 9605 TaxID=1173024 RepID=UPI00047CB667|nr:cation:proton antiporter [Fischerella sp. PCC 9605]
MNTYLQHLEFWEASLTQPLVFAPVLAQIFRPITDPVAIFLIILAIMLVAPLLFERLRMPGIIGLILAGVIVGPYGLGLLERDKTIELLGTVGLLFLMFLGGLETSLDDLKRNANKALTFGLATFAIPMVVGTAVMLPLGYSFLASVLVASCFASHTLLALPVLSKLGIMRNQVVTATLGGTLITNVLALLVLAIVVKANQGNLTISFWLFLIPSLAIYTFATLWGVPNLGRWFFRRFGHDEGAEFLFVLAALFIVSYIANLIEIEPIVGAFLAGVAITQIIPQMSPLMNRIQFIGNTLFVPFFLISVGMLVNPLILVKDARGILVAVVMIAAEIASKFLAAWGTAKIFNWKIPSTMVMFGLSVAQAASTLAAITVAFDIKLVDEVTVNGIIGMILVSCVMSPWITERWGRKIQQEPAHTATSNSEQLENAVTVNNLANRVLVPVANPNTEDNLLNLAIILTKHGNGTLLPLHVIISDKNGFVAVAAKTQQKRLLEVAETLAHAAVTSVEPIGRIDDSIDLGILRAAQERDASLVICGWKGYSTYRENFFGSVIDNIVRRSTVPVLITRFSQPIENTQRVFLALSDRKISANALRQTLGLTKILSEALKSPVQVMQVFLEPTKPSYDLQSVFVNSEFPIQQVQGNPTRKISASLKTNDLLILVESTHHFGQPALGREPEAIARSHPKTSMMIVHFPDLF